MALDSISSIDSSLSYGSNQVQQPLNLSNNSGSSMNSLYNSSFNSPNNYANDIMFQSLFKSPTSGLDSFTSNQDQPLKRMESADGESVQQQTAAQESQTPQAQNSGNSSVDNNVDSSDVVSSDESFTSKALKIVGVSAGALYPVLSKIPQLLKGAKVSKVLKFKQIAVMSPILALAGWGIGSLLGSLINYVKGTSNKTQVIANK